MTRWRIDPRHQDDLNLSLGLLFPAVGGLLLFGWRCVGVWAFVVGGALITRAVLSRFRTWIALPGLLSLCVQSLIVSLFLPATLFDVDHTLLEPDARWPALLAAGAALAIVDWAVRRFAGGRAQAAVVTATLLTLAFPWLVEARRVLRPQRLVGGDILDVRGELRPSGSAEPWVDVRPAAAPVLLTPPAAAALQDFVDRRPPPGRANQTVARLLGDDLPPLEDLVVGGHPAAVGRGSLVALLIGGLFLVYRGVTPLRVPALALLACYATLVVLPLPAGVGGGNTRRWLFERDPRVGWAAGLTLVHYLLAASAVPVVATFLATRPDVRPARRGAAALFAVAFGTLAAIATVFVSVAGGAVLALVVTQLLWPRVSTRAKTPTTPGAIHAG